MNIPESYKPGVRHIEDLNFEALQAWLEAELHEKLHILSGQADDYPVQAIVNHYLYLSLAAQKRLAGAVDALTLEWRSSPNDWPDSAARALLNLAAEIGVLETKSKLQGLIESGGLSSLNHSLRPAVFRTIATLSTNDDRKFWYEAPKVYPEYAGMAFQVLARIAPKVALMLLSQLPADRAAVDGVARKLPEFVSEFSPQQQVTILEQITKTLASLPPESAKPLQHALVEEGFAMGEINFPIPEQYQKIFVTQIISFAQTIRPRNELDEVYAGA